MYSSNHSDFMEGQLIIFKKLSCLNISNLPPTFVDALLMNSDDCRNMLQPDDRHL